MVCGKDVDVDDELKFGDCTRAAPGCLWWAILEEPPLRNMQPLFFTSTKGSEPPDVLIVYG